MKALLIPADQARKVEVIEISGRDDLRKHVGGIPEPTRYDSDALMFVSDTGRIDGKPMNVRATAYIRHESDAAWERGGLLTRDDSYGLYGDVVVVGDGGSAGMRDVPDRLVKGFGAEVPLRQRIVEGTPHTVAGEDLRNVVNLANEIEDVTPAERASLDRVETELRRPPFERPSFDRDEGNGYEL